MAPSHGATLRTSGLSAVLAARGITPSRVAIWAATWLSVGLAASVGLPWKYPHQFRDAVIDTAAVVAALAPTAYASASVLAESMPASVAIASRDLTGVRAAHALLVLFAAVVGATLVSLMAPLPRTLYVADSVIIAAACLTGASVVGAARAWLVPAFVVGISTVPGLVPLKWNLFYVHGLAEATVWASVVLSVAGVMAYSQWGDRDVARVS